MKISNDCGQIPDERLREMVSMVLSGGSVDFLSECGALFRRDFQMLEEEMEKKAAWLLLQSGTDDIAGILGPLADYEALIDQELELTRNITAHGGIIRAVFAGAGALPLSAILLAEKGGMHMTCLDSDPEAACLASRLLKKFFAHLAIDYTLADAAAFDYRGCDVVFVSSMANPKEKIFRRIRETAGTVPIITRTPAKDYDIFYNPVNEKGIAGCGYYINRECKNLQTMHVSICLLPLPDIEASSLDQDRGKGKSSAVG